MPTIDNEEENKKKLSEIAKLGNEKINNKSQSSFSLKERMKAYSENKEKLSLQSNVDK